MMKTQKIDFPTRQVLCVFPTQPAELGQALSELHLNESYPVIVLIGGECVFAHAEEGEIVRDQPFEKLGRLGDLVHRERRRIVLYGTAALFVMWLILYWMYRRKLFLRI
jgi:hypothetical protein